MDTVGNSDDARCTWQGFEKLSAHGGVKLAHPVGASAELKGQRGGVERFVRAVGRQMRPLEKLADRHTDSHRPWQ